MRLNEFDQAILVWGIISSESIAQLKSENTLIAVSEMRPYLVGLKHNIPLLKKADIDFFYCTDNMLGFLFYKNKIKKTLLFYKELKPQGLVGICGSLYVSLLSKLHSIPVQIIPQGKFNFKSSDLDALSLDGKCLILKKDINFVEAPKEEIVSWSVLK
ncbi:MAG: hypothetical protein NC900_04370 [Candidatus Omnitrophica bacterium]|nr:hypothetical protein [Candidatus Omnitrophota bacterium]MCM8799941.1 hypothetical protein [Candidatus Omnitrophota bacterium]